MILKCFWLLSLNLIIGSYLIEGLYQQETILSKQKSLVKRNEKLSNTTVTIEEPKSENENRHSSDSGGGGEFSNVKISHEREFPGLKVQTECHRDKSLIRVNFTRPFNGIIGVGNLETTKCKLNGSGEKFYELQVRHSQAKDCQTQWDNSTSSIVSLFFIRQHLHLETGNDVSMTVMCKLAVGDLIVGPAKRTKATKIDEKSRATAATTTNNNKRSLPNKSFR